MKKRLIAGLCVLATAALVTACSTDSTPATKDAKQETVNLQVFNASSTRVAEKEITNVAQQEGLNVSFNNGGSSTLVAQLAEGAPADVLITADTRNMDKAIEDGSVSDAEKFLTNSMVMVVPKGNPAGIKTVKDVEHANLVLCDPQVPCGTVSQALIKANDLTVNPVSLESAVGDVLGKVLSGEAEAGWVYRTDAAAAGDDVEVIDIPHAEENPNTLWIAPTTNSTHPEAAKKLVDLITGDTMDSVWEKAGFSLIK